MNAKRSFTISLLLFTVCLVQLLLVLNMDGVHGKKRRHRTVQRAAKTNKTVGIGIKNKICADENGIWPRPKQQQQQEQQQQQMDKELNPWGWKSDDNSFAFDHAAITTLFYGVKNGTSAIISNTTMEKTTPTPSTTASSSMTAIDQQKLNDEQQQQKGHENSGEGGIVEVNGGGEQLQKKKDKVSENEPMNTVPKSEMSANELAQTEVWVSKTEESVELGKNQLKPCPKFTGDGGAEILSSKANLSMAIAPPAEEHVPTVGQQPSMAVLDNVFGTLPPGFEPSSPAYASPDEMGLNNNKLVEFDAPSPTQQAIASLHIINDSISSLNTNQNIGPFQPVETSTISASSRSTAGLDGIDQSKYWSFTRLPFINRTELAISAPLSMAFVPSNNTKARKEDSWAADLELKPPHLGQADFFTPTDANRNKTSEEKLSIPDITKCAGAAEAEGADNVQTVKETEEEESTVIPPIVTLLLDTVRNMAVEPTKSQAAEGILPVSADQKSSSEKWFSTVNDTVATVTTAEAAELAKLPAETHTVTDQQRNDLINFNAEAIGNKTVANIDQHQNKIEGGDQQQRKWEENGILTKKTNGTPNEGKVEQLEENCCNLLRLLKGKTDNGTTEFSAAIDGVGADDVHLSELFSADTELRDQQQNNEAISDNKLGEKRSQLAAESEREQHQKGDEKEEEANGDKLEGGTIKANWKVISEAVTPTTTTTTTKVGMEILKELGEEKSEQLQNHAIVLPDRTLPTFSSTILDNAIELVTVPTNYDTTFPWTTSAPMASKKWTPYVFDCALETDERGESLCQEWAKGGLCDINRATRFLFCRKTCLCIGILDE